MIDRLRKTMEVHLIEMFNGIIDEVFVHKRMRVAQVHVKIDLKTNGIYCTTNC
jgi:heme-based aerotactic transducer